MSEVELYGRSELGLPDGGKLVLGLQWDSDANDFNVICQEFTTTGQVVPVYFKLMKVGGQAAPDAFEFHRRQLNRILLDRYAGSSVGNYPSLPLDEMQKAFWDIWVLARFRMVDDGEGGRLPQLLA